MPDVLTNIVKDYAHSWDCINTVKIEDDKWNSNIKSLSPGISSLAISPDNNILVISSNNKIKIFRKNKTTKSFIIKDIIEVVKFDRIEAITFINNSQLAVVCHEDQNIKIYDLNINQLIKTIKTNHKSYYSGKCLAMLFNDNNIAYSDDSGIIQIFDLNTETCIKEIISGHNSGAYSISGLTVLNNGNLVSVSHQNRFIKIWDLEKNICIETLNSDEYFPNSLISLTDNRIAIGYYGKIDVWDLQNKKIIATLDKQNEGPKYRVSGLAKLSTGELISADMNGIIKTFANPTHYKIDNSEVNEIFYV